MFKKSCKESICTTHVLKAIYIMRKVFSTELGIESNWATSNRGQYFKRNDQDGSVWSSECVWNGFGK